MSSSVISQVILPLALFMIMLGVGMSLRLADFRLLISKPKVVVVGLVLQLILLPCLGLLVVTLFNLPAALAVGIMILTFAPGGATSNMITYLSRGDTALSVCLTGICGLITPLTMPLLTAMALSFWMEQGDCYRVSRWTYHDAVVCYRSGSCLHRCTHPLPLAAVL